MYFCAGTRAMQQHPFLPEDKYSHREKQWTCSLVKDSAKLIVLFLRPYLGYQAGSVTACFLHLPSLSLSPSPTTPSLFLPSIHSALHENALVLNALLSRQLISRKILPRRPPARSLPHAQPPGDERCGAE